MAETNQTPVQTIESRAQKKARLVEVLDRGITIDRITVKLPDDKHGEWVPNDQSEIARMESMGFVIDRELVKNRTLHEGDGAAKVGDVIFMTCSRETKELIDEIRQEKFIQMHGSKRDKRHTLQREEADFERQNPLRTINESEESTANAERIREALSAK